MKIIGYIVILLIIFAFWGIKFRLNQELILSDNWYMVKSSQWEGYLIYPKEDRTIDGFYYITVEDMYLDKENRMIYIRNHYPNELRYYYQKIYLDEYGLYKLKEADTVSTFNHVHQLKALDFISPMRYFIFGFP